MDEFDFIRQILSPLSGPEGLGLKDDAALFTPTDGHQLVITKDAMVEGVHFPDGHYGGNVAEKLLRVNLSDLAAKGARPLGYCLSLAIPRSVTETHLRGFASGLKDVQQAYDFTLWGGDTVSTSGPFVVSATFIGQVPTGKMVKRSGAEVGDDVWLTGTIGDAYLGLQNVLGKSVQPRPTPAQLWQWEEAYLRPVPRLLFRKILRQYASAALDISDGFLADAEHLAQSSGISLEFDIGHVPLSQATQNWLDAQMQKQAAYESLLSGGDDYEILFTARLHDSEAIEKMAADLGLEVTKIGRAVRQTETDVKTSLSGKPVKFEKKGYIHKV